MTKRVEGRIALKVHGTEDASLAGSVIFLAFADIQDRAAETNEALVIEVVQLDLVQVEEEDEEEERYGDFTLPFINS